MPASAPTRPVSSILVGTDFSPCSAVALQQAIRIAGWSQARVRVAHVIDTVVVVEVESAVSPIQRGIRESLTDDATRAWVAFAKGVPGASALPIEVTINNRIVGLLQRASADSADLLVMGAFGSRTPDVGFGTVATACVRKSTADVLLVRDTQPGAFKTIVAAVDFSETSLRALQRAAFFAKMDGAELHILHVYTPPWSYVQYNEFTPVIDPQLQAEYRTNLERRLAEFTRPIVDAQPGLRSRLAVHDYSGHRSGIVQYASSVSADLIVLGTRGRTNLRDILLGSTAEKVLQNSVCSVLAVKPEGFSHPLAS